ncbi:MAG: alkaline shock response membrane anchor protein AmaP [Syntrophomonas sp.]|nr:alkaline shock response membrane anchor protein AmaP [Syntrophomonas sp.]
MERRDTMPVLMRLVLLINNLIIMVISGAVVAVCLGLFSPVVYYEAALSTPENRMIIGAVGLIIGILALIIMIWVLKPAKHTDNVLVDKDLAGEISISTSAIKAIITKAAKMVEGVKDLKSTVSNTPEGLIVKLHIMINTEYTVPELAHSLQTAVKDDLVKIGGLQVAEIKVLIDDSNAVSK